MKSRLLNRATIATILLIVFWACLFLATHLPLKSMGVDSHLSDKILHFMAYAGLAVLLCGAIASRRKFTIATCVAVVVVAMVYGAVDELLQIPIGSRTAEWSDWAADVAGAACGVLAFAAIRAAAQVSWQRPRLTDRTVEMGGRSRPTGDP